MTQEPTTPCPTCTRPIDDPQTCQTCGKITCTDCAMYSEDGDHVWCEDCGLALEDAAEREAAPGLAQQVDGLIARLAPLRIERDAYRGVVTKLAHLSTNHPTQTVTPEMLGQLYDAADTVTHVHGCEDCAGRTFEDGQVTCWTCGRALPSQADEAPVPQSQALRDVIDERARQVSQEGWTPAHDDGHAHGQLVGAAICYALTSIPDWMGRDAYNQTLWPWAKPLFKPTTPRRDLVKAAALILAEIERLDRLEARHD